MNLRERVEKWWTIHPAEPVTFFIGLWISMIISGSLFQALSMEIP